MAGFEFIRDLEVQAFALGGGDFVFPAQTIRAYMEGRTDDGPLPKTSFPKPLRWADFRRLFPPKLALALQESFRNFDRKMPGFIDQGLIIGPESRTSSPVRILPGPAHPGVGVHPGPVPARGGGRLHRRHRLLRSRRPAPGGWLGGLGARPRGPGGDGPPAAPQNPARYRSMLVTLEVSRNDAGQGPNATCAGGCRP